MKLVKKYIGHPPPGGAGDDGHTVRIKKQNAQKPWKNKRLAKRARRKRGKTSTYRTRRAENVLKQVKTGPGEKITRK